MFVLILGGKADIFKRIKTILINGSENSSHSESSSELKAATRCVSVLTQIDALSRGRLTSELDPPPPLIQAWVRTCTNNLLDALKCLGSCVVSVKNQQLNKRTTTPRELN